MLVLVFDAISRGGADSTRTDTHHRPHHAAETRRSSPPQPASVETDSVRALPRQRLCPAWRGEPAAVVDPQPRQTMMAATTTESGQVPPSAVSSSFGIKGLLQLCDIKSTCQLGPVASPAVAAPARCAAHPRDRQHAAGAARASPAALRRARPRAAQDPEAATEGMGGTYFLMNEAGGRAALMKPCDEEPLAPNNPKGFVGRQLGDPGLKPSVRVGEAAIREVAAYLLDHDHRAKVPTTILVRASHSAFHVAPDAAAATGGEGSADSSPTRMPTKLGSLQEYMPHICDSSDVGSTRFNKQNIHRVGILDLRLLNTDRHSGNLLVRKPEQAGSSAHMGLGKMLLEGNQLELVPIDHGFCLPDSLEEPYFEWLHWPQAMLPFDEEELEYIEELDVEADLAVLRSQLPMLREDCLRTLVVSTTILKKCAAAGLTLHEIGSVYSRPMVGIDDEPSELEKLCTDAWAYMEDRTAGSEIVPQLLEGCEEEDEEEESDEETAWGLSDSASSYRGSSSGPKSALKKPWHELECGSLAGRPEEVERFGSPLEESAALHPGSPHELMFDLDVEALMLSPTASSLVQQHSQDQSLHGEADSWALQAFTVASISAGASPHPAPASPGSLGLDRAVSDEINGGCSDFLARSLRPPSHFFSRRKDSAANGLISGGRVGCSRRRDRLPYPPKVQASRPPPAVVAKFPGFGGMDAEQWNLFVEGLNIHLDAALRAGKYEHENQQGTAASRALFGTSAPV
eukprot:jgi/Tetstr1/453824/TSEL_040775.t1